MESKLKLTIDLVPSTSWWSNLRQKISTAEWNKIRKSCYAKYDYRCGICGATGRMNCHEIWDYDDKKHIQTLKDFLSLCDLCHHVKHIGFAEILAKENKLNLREVISHFMKVNNCDLKTFKKHYDFSFKNWNTRSTHEWKLNLGDYDSLLK